MRIDTTAFRVEEGETPRLRKRPTRATPVYASKEEYRTLLEDHVGKLSALQQKLYASNQYAVLLILQAMDAAGKDGTIKHVMSGVNPQGCEVTSFKHPTPAELEHDFLWRTTCALPMRGKIGIFNRSYYEEVLIARVHPEILRAEAIPGGPRDPAKLWKARYRSIVELERHLNANGTRIDDPEKNWKFSRADLKERGFWAAYQDAYEECLRATSTRDAPWFVVPADDKENARLVVSQILVDTLEALQLEFPRLDAGRRRELRSIRRELEP
jgi:polyphosphate kinase 2 (PPK2 family)